MWDFKGNIIKFQTLSFIKALKKLNCFKLFEKKYQYRLLSYNIKFIYSYFEKSVSKVCRFRLLLLTVFSKFKNVKKTPSSVSTEISEKFLNDFKGRLARRMKLQLPFFLVSLHSHRYWCFDEISTRWSCPKNYTVSFLPICWPTEMLFGYA